jgi:hypothetical protein
VPATVDYVDFVQANGRNYIAGLTSVPPISSTDLGVRPDDTAAP